ncbi:uncharacterized protein BJ212DRAFT_181971 [Suillus subaureus]|uniref:Uncharacterized protein n=1 Tax=Suillus subaureus TaxID=48587 RepID=A0A9P7DNJ1_9AGAM|nr:uncharacterized protein BJ212DRAFT_181971 [Suillus subaureus]KAG1799136.1 hypothetical protein BJ212DRAFT_181971 [Suillus subaureus]
MYSVLPCISLYVLCTTLYKLACTLYRPVQNLTGYLYILYRVVQREPSLWALWLCPALSRVVQRIPVLLMSSVSSGSILDFFAVDSKVSVALRLELMWTLWNEEVTTNCQS